MVDRNASFEPAAGLATTHVPVVAPGETAGAVRAGLAGQAFDCGTFDKVGIDPAFGSGPLATVIQDLLSIWIYLTVATAIVSG